MYYIKGLLMGKLLVTDNLKYFCKMTSELSFFFFRIRRKSKQKQAIGCYRDLCLH